MVTWTAEKDQQLLKGVFQFLDLKASGPLLQHLADMIGEGCTPKAVSHRLTNIKNTGKPIRGPNATPTKATGAPKAAATPKSTKATPAKTPGSGRGSGRPKKVANEPDNDLDGGASPTPGRKRGRTTEADGENDNTSKKIKPEPAEEEALKDEAKEEGNGIQDEI